MIWGGRNSREDGKSLAGLVSMLLLVLLVAGCDGGESEGGASADGEGAPRAAAPPMQLELELAAGHGEPLKVKVPSEPVATAPSGMPGATLEVYALQRSGPESVTLLFGLALDEDADPEGIGISPIALRAKEPTLAAALVPKSTRRIPFSKRIYDRGIPNAGFLGMTTKHEKFASSGGRRSCQPIPSQTGVINDEEP